MSIDAAPNPPTGTTRGLWSRWPIWTAYAAVVWSTVYALAAALWTFGGAGYPFSREQTADSDYQGMLAGTTADTIAPIMAGLGLAGAVVACLMVRTARRASPPRTPLRWPVAGLGVAVAVLLAVVLPESFALKYLPPMGLLVFLRPPDWPIVNLLVLLIGGLLWAAATVAYVRGARGACANCGRSEHAPRRGVADGVLRWGRVVTYVAAAAPLVYAVSRLSWAANIPIGAPQAFVDHINAANPGNGTRIMEVALAGFAIGGSVLTIGLLRPWGEVFPRWIPGLAGRRVPIAFPVGFAGLVTCGVTAFGVSMVGGIGGFFADGMVVGGYQMDVFYALPMVAFPVWGVSLGLAAYAYYLRRRGACRWCARGAESP